MKRRALLLTLAAAGLPVAAKESGARLVILNREPTPLDDLADMVIRADIGTVLDAVRRELDGGAQD